jgi:hypothetical protein
MTPTREGLLNTIRALLEMTVARGCTKPEAALARSKALELMEKYGITLRDLSGPPPVERGLISPEPSHRLDPENGRPFKGGRRTGIYSHDAFIKEIFARKTGANKRSAPIVRAARFVAAYGAVGFIIWTVAVSRPANNSQSNSSQFRSGLRNISKGTKPVETLILPADEAKYSDTSFQRVRPGSSLPP